MDATPGRRRIARAHATAILAARWWAVGVFALLLPVVVLVPFACKPQANRVAVVGYLHRWQTEVSGPSPLLQAFREGMAEHGYVEGVNLILEVRSAEGKPERYPELVAELLSRPVEVLVLGESEPIPGAKAATSTLPLVMTLSGDVVGQELVESLAHPGGNLTGLTNLSKELSGKRLEYLTQIAPGATQVAVLWNPANSSAQLQWQETAAAAEPLNITLASHEVVRPTDVPAALDAAFAGGAQALLVLQDPLTSSQRAQIVKLAADHRLPAIYGVTEIAEIGGLIAYGPDRLAMQRRAAAYVDKILKGAYPGDLPIEQPSRFELVVNVGTARALGMSVPRSIRENATRVIE
jgi:putative ABC transport system substrate-binding protein